ncbi:MAG: DUF4304 domain-containing protein [Acidovorax sp.]|nr:DUF4304 domain-containing protein [Acidovorax sp.]
MNFDELQQAVDAAMSEALTGAGFRRRAPGVWNRRQNDDLNVIQLQEHSSEKLFCVNLGVHYSFLPKAGSQVPLGVDEQIELPDCEFKLRLTDQVAAKDQWWPIAAVSAMHVAALTCSRGLEVLDSYQIDGQIGAMDGKDVESGNLGLLASLTKVRACLLLARMHERLGNRDKCVEAASIGIKLAGMAVGPKKALKEILVRLG